MATNWYYQTGDDVVGPVSGSDIRQLTADGQISRQTLVRPADREEWIRAEHVRGLFASAPTPTQQSPSAPPSENDRSWYLRDIAGNILGPVSKAQLDEWLREGRLNAECQLRHEDWEGWRGATAVYPTLSPGKLALQRISQNVSRGWRIFRRQVNKYLANATIPWLPSPPHLRRCITNTHHQYSTHSTCLACGAPSVGLRASDVVNGDDRKRQEVFEIWSQGRKRLTQVFASSAVVGALLCLVLLCTTWWSLVLVPLIASIVIALPLITAKTVNGRINRRLATQIGSASPNITDEQVHQLNDKLIAPFLRRNEVPPGTIPPANAFLVKRLKSLDQVTDVLIEPQELQMLHQLLAAEGVTLWSTADDAQVVLTAISLKNDYALFKQRMQQLATGGMSLLAAYASLVSEDMAFLPFLQQMLAEQGIPEGQSSLLNALASARRQLQLRGFAKDLEQRRHGSMSLTLEMVDAMDPYNFELLLGMIYESQGYRVIETPKSGDQGADVLLERAGERTVVQAKLYSDSVGNKAVQEAIAARSHFRCHAAKVVTNSSFTPSARQLAESSDVELVGRDQLTKMIDEFNRNPKDYSRLAELMKSGTWAGSQRSEESV